MGYWMGYWMSSEDGAGSRQAHKYLIDIAGILILWGKTSIMARLTGRRQAVVTGDASGFNISLQYLKYNIEFDR